MPLNIQLKNLRESKKLSQTAVAKGIGVSRQTYNNYEAGRRNPDTDMLKTIAEYFGVTTDYLLSIEISESIEKEKIPADLKKILEEQQVMFDGEIVSDEEKELVKNMLTTMYGIAKKNNKRKKS